MHRFTIALCALFLSARAQVGCYYPGGHLVEADTPCQPHLAHSTCCNPADICLSNGLCFIASVNRLTRGSCTDSSWSDGSCSDICTNTADGPWGWSNVLPCQNTTLPQFFYCGGSNNASCGGPKIFNLPKGFFADLRNASLSSTNSSQLASNSSCNNINSPPSTNATMHHCSTLASVEAAIGAGVGLPLALGLAAAFVLLLRERRLRKEDAKGAHENALFQQQYEVKPPPPEKDSVGVPHEADSMAKPNIFEVPDNAR